MRRTPRTVFLLSPASLTGLRSAMLLREQARFPLACALRTPPGAPLADVFTFLSGLYFRGKVAYARAFARPPRRGSGALVITSGAGLRPLHELVDADRLRALGEVPIDPADPRYLKPLLADARSLAASMPRGSRIVLLGSIATRKYVEPLLEVAKVCCSRPPSWAAET